MKKSFPQKTGSFLAVLQSLLDDLFAALFKGLKHLGTHTSEQKDQETEAPMSVKKKALHLGRRAAQFIGEAGESYYETYENIKSRKSKKKD